MPLENLRLLPEPEAIGLLASHSIPYPAHGLAHNAAEAVEVAERIGYPVVLKIVSPDVAHKSDAGGVRVGLADAGAVERAYPHIMASVEAHHSGARSDGMLVCRQAPDGLEVIVGGLVDRVLGPAVMFGLGGIFAEVLKDVSFRLAPLTEQDARELMGEIKGYPLLAGARGQPARDREALARLLVAVGNLLAEHPAIVELDLNPVRLYEQGLLALDARILYDPGKGALV